jgi:hypothetical protein
VIGDKKGWPPNKNPRPHSRLDVPPGNTPVIDSPRANVNRAYGPQAYVYQSNQLSTPVMVLLIALLFVSAAVAAVAIGIAMNANYTAFLAERKAAIANNHADVATAKVQHLEDVMTIRGIVIPPQESADVE